MDLLIVNVATDSGALDSPALTFGVALAVGVIASTLAHHLRLPGIVLFLAAGVFFGPEVLNLVRPATLGHGLETIVGLAVAVILFEGGLNLNIGRLRSQAQTIRRLVTIGAAVTALGGALAAHYVMGWSWQLAALFGTLVVVTGPTVVAPLVRRIRLIPRLQTILEAEGVLIDPIGAVIAVVSLEIVLDLASGSMSGLGVLGIPTRLVVGAVIGTAGGFVVGWVLGREHVVPEELRNVFTLALVLALFAVSEAVVAESGIMAAPVAGIIVGNMKTRVHEDLREFKESLTTMLVGMLFVILAADVSVADVTALGAPGLVTIALLMFVVRPVNVALSTRGSGLALKEKAFIAWLGPRGIVAAAVASLFAQRLAANGLEGGVELQALVFAVIAATVVVQGLSGEWIAQAFGLRKARNQGYAIVGANAVGMTLARILRDGGQPIVLLDSNAGQAATAKEEGFEVVYGDASNSTTLYRADVEGRRGFLTVTLNDGANLFIAGRAADLTSNVTTYVTEARERSAVQSKQIAESGHRVLFGRSIDIVRWDRLFRADDAMLSRWEYRGDKGSQGGAELIQGQKGAEAQLLPLTQQRKKTLAPIDDRTTLKQGDVVVMASLASQNDAVVERMGELEFIKLEDSDGGDVEDKPAPAAAGDA